MQTCNVTTVFSKQKPLNCGTKFAIHKYLVFTIK